MTMETDPTEETVSEPRDGRLVEILNRLAQGDGYSQSRLQGVKFMRSTQPVIRSKVSYDPSIVIVAQGRKRGYLGESIFTYDANHFLVLSVPLPFECETLASPDGPLLGLTIAVTPTAVTELIMEMEKPLPIPRGRSQAIHANPMDDPLYDATVRLVSSLESENDARILGPQIVREIIYRVITGDNGETLRALAAPHSHFGQISRVLQRIHRDYAKAMDMTNLAAEAGMSLSTFHSHFKAVTSSPPLQYLKTIRLHKARIMMVQSGETAARAAQLVGYESASQFSREFKRLFGQTPAAEAEKIKASLVQLT